MANIVFGSGKLHWTPSGGSEIYLAETPELSVRVEFELVERYHLPTGSTLVEVQAADVERVRRVGRFTTRDISASGLALFLAVAGPAVGALRFESANSIGSDRDLTIPSLCLYPDGDWELKGRREAMRLPFAFLVYAPANGTAPWSVGVAH